MLDACVDAWNAVTSAYRRTIKLMNDTVRNFIDTIPLPGTSTLAALVDFEKLVEAG